MLSRELLNDKDAAINYLSLQFAKQWKASRTLTQNEAHLLGDEFYDFLDTQAGIEFSNEIFKKVWEFKKDEVFEGMKKLMWKFIDNITIKDARDTYRSEETKRMDCVFNRGIYGDE